MSTSAITARAIHIASKHAEAQTHIEFMASEARMALFHLERDNAAAASEWVRKIIERAEKAKGAA